MKLITRKEVAALFKIGRQATYDIKGLDTCRVAVPGIAVVRFDEEKVLALLNKRRKSASAA
ncbi:MAG: hypothetical protein ACO1Q7_01990 [Gemmatimonas sp.]